MDKVVDKGKRVALLLIDRTDIRIYDTPLCTLLLLRTARTLPEWEYKMPKQSLFHQCSQTLPKPLKPLKSFIVPVSATVKSDFPLQQHKHLLIRRRLDKCIKWCLSQDENRFISSLDIRISDSSRALVRRLGVGRANLEAFSVPATLCAALTGRGFGSSSN